MISRLIISSRMVWIAEYFAIKKNRFWSAKIQFAKNVFVSVQLRHPARLHICLRVGTRGHKQRPSKHIGIFRVFGVLVRHSPRFWGKFFTEKRGSRRVKGYKGSKYVLYVISFFFIYSCLLTNYCIYVQYMPSRIVFCVKRVKQQITGQMHTKFSALQRAFSEKTMQFSPTEYKRIQANTANTKTALRTTWSNKHRPIQIIQTIQNSTFC